MKIQEHNGKNLSYISSEPDNHCGDLGAIILMHGFGANMHDLLGIAPMIDQENFLYIFPNAPIKLNQNMGQRSRSWFSFDDYKKINESQKILSSTIEESLSNFSINQDRIFLGGFSQGGMMTIHSDLELNNIFKGAIILSSKVIPDIEINLGKSLKENSNIFLAHGKTDSIISIEEGREANNLLSANGLEVEYHEYQMGHQIIEEEMDHLKVWLLK